MSQHNQTNEATLRRQRLKCQQCEAVAVGTDSMGAPACFRHTHGLRIASRHSISKARRYTYRVVRIRDGADCGEHTSEALAEKRLGRLVSMSNGKMTAADFRIEEIKP